MDGSEHDCNFTGFGIQNDDQVVPELNIDQTDDPVLCNLTNHVLMCNKVVDFLMKETRSAYNFPDPFSIVRHDVIGDDSLSTLRICLKIENRPIDKSTLEILGILIICNCASLGIDGRSIQQASTEKPRVVFKFIDLSMTVELMLVSSNQHAIY